MKSQCIPGNSPFSYIGIYCDEYSPLQKPRTLGEVVPQCRWCSKDNNPAALIGTPILISSHGSRDLRLVGLSNKSTCIKWLKRMIIIHQGGEMQNLRTPGILRLLGTLGTRF